MFNKSVYLCPKCRNKTSRIRSGPSLDSFVTGFIADIGFQIVWLVLAATIAAVAYRVFGDTVAFVIAFVIVFALVLAIDHAIARFRCTVCDHEMSRNERIRS